MLLAGVVKSLYPDNVRDSERGTRISNVLFSS